MEKVILVAGASSSIGATGARLLLGARRVDRIEALASAIREITIRPTASAS